MSTRNGCGDFALGLLFGAVLGTTVALLLAPKSGRETREVLLKGARKLAVKTLGPGLDVDEWFCVATEEAGRAVVENLHGIRSAGL